MMKTKFFALALMAALAGSFSGCVQTVNDSTQFGIPFVKDDAQGSYTASVAELVAAGREVLSAQGKLTDDNIVKNALVARVDGSTVYVRVTAVDEAKPITKVVVQARTPGGAADPDLASSIQTKIALKAQAKKLAE